MSRVAETVPESRSIGRKGKKGKMLFCVQIDKTHARAHGTAEEFPENCRKHIEVNLSKLEFREE